jgi:glycine/D-amino acid oxidase-like deaminating enzyme/nitrite reductase/ring-hydroxylating ferredoxin subunit
MDPQTPLWIATAPGTSYPTLESPPRADVVVVGGGIAGLTAALLLRKRGADVVLLESDRVGLGATSRATVKVTASHSLRCGEIASRHGDDAASVYAEMNRAAIDTIVELARTHSIECSLERRRHLVCAETDAGKTRVEQEVELERRIGSPVSFSHRCDLPFPVTGCLVMEDQAQFHPRRYLLGLAEAFVDSGGSIFEGSRATNVHDGDPCRVEVNGVEIETRDVVVASGAPISDRGLLMARMTPLQEYAVAAELTDGAGPAEMYISESDGRWSLRTADIGGRRYLIVVGGKHEVGVAPDTDPYEALAAWARQHFEVEAVAYRWSTHDLWPGDSLPYVGQLDGADHLWVATGFGGWGMTNGTAAASVLTQRIDEGGDGGDAGRLLDPARGDITAAAGPFIRQNAAVAGRWIGDRFTSRPDDVADVGRGHGDVIREGRDLVAVYRDDHDEIHAVSAVCTHMGCIVRWNVADRTWDCPCHGSRFDIDGNVVRSPANEPLRRVEPAPGTADRS